MPQLVMEMPANVESDPIAVIEEPRPTVAESHHHSGNGNGATSQALASSDDVNSLTAQVVQHLVKKEAASEETIFGLSFFALMEVEGLGRRGINALYDVVEGRLEKVWELSQPYLKTVLQHRRIPSADEVASKIFNQCEKYKARGLELVEEFSSRKIAVLPRWRLPDSLSSIPDAPRWLCVEGTPAALHNLFNIAIVGTRTPSDTGLSATDQVVTDLSVYPFALVSGLADGIDAQAHDTALRLGIPNVAFLGHGINLTFPRGTAPLRQQIIEQGGAVASEYLPSDTYRKSQFVERNRLQAALSNIVIPVEAKATSGTAHTVRFAKEYHCNLIGIELGVENGILSEFATEAIAVIDIFSDAGCKNLDKAVRSVMKKAGLETYPLKDVERVLLQGVRRREITYRDIEKLIEALKTEWEQLYEYHDA